MELRDIDAAKKEIRTALKNTYNTPKMKEMLSIRQKRNRSGSACGKRIVQLDKSFNFINEWRSTTQAADTLGICQSCISACLTGRISSSHGYRWMYFKDYELWKEKFYLKERN